MGSFLFGFMIFFHIIVIKDNMEEILMHKVIIHDYKKGGKRKYTIDGITYDSRNAMMEKFNLCESTINRFKRELNLSMEDAVSYAIDYRQAQDKKLYEAREKNRQIQEEQARKRSLKAEKNQFVFRGNVYSSFIICCRHYEKKFNIWINDSSIKTRAKANGVSLQEQFEKTIKRLLRKRFRDMHRENKRYGILLVNTKEKADRYAKLLGEDRIICRCITAYSNEDWKQRGSHLHEIVYRYNNNCK